jgi:hypothetical protein
MHSENLKNSVEEFLVQIDIDVQSAKKSFETGDCYGYYEHHRFLAYTGRLRKLRQLNSNRSNFPQWT